MPSGVKKGQIIYTNTDLEELFPRNKIIRKLWKNPLKKILMYSKQDCCQGCWQINMTFKYSEQSVNKIISQQELS